MEIYHKSKENYYDLVPEKYAPFSERRMNDFMFNFCNSIGLERKRIIAIEQLKSTHVAYRIYYEELE